MSLGKHHTHTHKRLNTSAKDILQFYSTVYTILYFKQGFAKGNTLYPRPMETTIWKIQIAMTVRITNKGIEQWTYSNHVTGGSGRTGVRVSSQDTLVIVFIVIMV